MVTKIYCPRCGRKVTSWDGKSEINLLAKCTNCNMLVKFDVNTEKTEIIRKPVRKQSSGLTFY